jgi:glucokinase
LENLASGTAIAHIARKRLGAGESSLLQGMYKKDPLLITGEQVFMALGRKDPLAESVVRNAARALGYALQNLVVLLDLKQIVLGGGVPSSSPQYLAWVRDAMVSQSNRTDEVTVELTDLGDYTAVLGGTIMAREKLQELG